MYSTSDFRNGLKLLWDGNPYELIYFQHVKPGKGGAFVRTKLKNLKNNSILERTFRSGEKFGVPDIADTEMQFLYADDSYHFMDTGSYEQVDIPSDVVGGGASFLKEGVLVRILFFDSEVLNIELPNFVNLEVVECSPGVKGDTVSGATKPAKLETGLELQVPLFVNEGDVLKVDTRVGQYVERA